MRQKICVGLGYGTSNLLAAGRNNEDRGVGGKERETPTRHEP